MALAGAVEAVASFGVTLYQYNSSMMEPSPTSIVLSFMLARARANSWSIDSPSMRVEAQRRLFTRSGNPCTNAHARPWLLIPPNNTERLRNSAR